jgi:hypothetical protein
MPVNIQLACPCGCPGAYVVNDDSINLGNWRALAIAGEYRCCTTCGCAYRLTDGGTSIGLSNVSCPRIDSLDTTTGPLAGGTTVNVTGHGFTTGTLTVNFDDVPATIIGTPTLTAAQVTSPAGRVALVEQGPHQTKLTLTGVSGTFSPGESLKVAAGFGVGFVGSVGGSFIYAVNYPQALAAGSVIAGVNSGASGTVSAVGTDFQFGEILTGQTSGATASVVQSSPLRVSSITGTFATGEWVLGATSAAMAQLSNTTATSKSVVVTVSNGNGLRPTTGRFYSFDYT